MRRDPPWRRLAVRAASTRTSGTRPRTGSRRSRSTGPEVRNAFRPADADRGLRRARRARARTLDVGVIVLTGEGPLAFCSGGDQRVRGDSGYLPRTTPAARRRALPRHRPPGADRRLPEARRRDGRRVRDRRRPRAPHRLRPDDRRRQRPLRPDRPDASARSTAASARALLADAGRPEEGEGDLVPLPPVRRRSRRSTWGW